MFETNASAPRLGAGGAQTLRRIMKECEEIEGEKNPFWTAFPLNMEDPFEWHFTVRGPVDTEFEGGLYHGRLILPPNYPLSAPSIFLLNQNGRFEVGKKVCMSASPYHPELWQPAWGLRTMFDALHVFFATSAEGAVNSLDWPVEARRKLAVESVNWRCPICKKTNQEIAEERCLSPTSDGPTLPSMMVPSSLSNKCRYLRAKTDKTQTPPPEQSPELPPLAAVQRPTSSAADLQARRERRRKAISSTTAMRSMLPSLLRALWRPIPTLCASFLRSSPAAKLIKITDAILLLLLVVIIVLIAGFFRRPGPLINAFYLDNIE